MLSQETLGLAAATLSVSTGIKLKTIASHLTTAAVRVMGTTLRVELNVWLFASRLLALPLERPQQPQNHPPRRPRPSDNSLLAKRPALVVLPVKCQLKSHRQVCHTHINHLFHYICYYHFLFLHYFKSLHKKRTAERAFRRTMYVASRSRSLPRKYHALLF